MLNKYFIHFYAIFKWVIINCFILWSFKLRNFIFLKLFGFFCYACKYLMYKFSAFVLYTDTKRPTLTPPRLSQLIHYTTRLTLLEWSPRCVVSCSKYDSYQLIFSLLIILKYLRWTWWLHFHAVVQVGGVGGGVLLVHLLRQLARGRRHEAAPLLLHVRYMFSVHFTSTRNISFSYTFKSSTCKLIL